MHKPTTLSRLGGLLSAALSAVGDKAKLPESATFGPNPTLPTPRKERIPTVHIARAKGWPEGATPKAAPGFQVNAYAAVAGERVGQGHAQELLLFEPAA